MAEKRRVGHVERKPNGRYLARIRCGVRADGKPRVVAKTHDTEADAEAWLVAKSVELGRRPDLGAGVTLEALWQLYERDKLPKLAGKTRYNYAWHMRVWLESMGDVDVTAITATMVQSRLYDLTHDNARHAKVVLSSVLTYGQTVGVLAEHPLRGHAFELPQKQERAADYDDDPFATIEGTRDVWDARTVLAALPLMRGLPLEPAWLACVGAGLRVEEALALRKMDVRRVELAGRMVVQLAVHAARTDRDRRKATKTRQSVRIVAVMEPFGSRLWEIVAALPNRDSLVCALSASRQNKAWRNYFAEPPTSKHTPKSTTARGRLRGLPYVPLSRMRATHETLMQEAGVLDSLNAAAHGHSERVSREHYLRGDLARATEQAESYLKLVV